MSRRLGSFDLVFEVGEQIMGFQLAAPSMTVSMSPGRLDEVTRAADVPRVIDNLDAGMGFSRRVTGAPTNGYAYALPGFTRSPGGIFSPAGKVTQIPVPGVPGIVDSVRFRDTIFLITNNNIVLKLAPDGLSAVVETILPVGFGARAGGTAVFGNKLYIASGTGLVSLDGTTGVWSSVASGVVRSLLAVVNWRPLGVPTDVLVGMIPAAAAGQVDRLTWCPMPADPMNPAAWVAPIPVGADARYTVSKLVTSPRHVYMLRPDGVYDVDELGVRAFNIAPWVSETVDYLNGGWGLHIGDGLYYGHANGLAFVPTTGETQYRPEWAHPGWGLPYEGQVRGFAAMGTLHAGWGLTALHADQAYICAGRRDPQNAYGQATHVWHGAEAVFDRYVQHMKAYTLEWAGGQPRLLVTTSDGTPTGARAYWQSLPRTGSAIQEMVQGGGFQPADAASLFLPADPWDRPSSVKQLLQFDMLAERLAVGSDTLQAYAAADTETTWTSYGVAEDDQYSSWAPLETVEGRYIRTRVDAVGHPILRSVELRSAVGVELREARRYTVILAWDNALAGSRARETKDPQRRWQDLQALLGRVCLLDDTSSRGTARVRVLQVLQGEKRPMGAAARDGAWSQTAEIVVSFLDRPFRWDGTALERFDSDRVWV